jgi:predicted SAM-dependent methyltransferase
MTKLHLGCGWRDFGPDWVHIDGGDYPHLKYKDITLLPFEDNTVDLIYASHVVEYFDREEVLSILKEWNRVLKHGAVLRIAVPNFRVISELYLNENMPIEKFLGPMYGKMKMDNQTIYHRTIYDFNSLKNTLESCGFTNTSEYDWRKTEHSMFDDHSQAYIPHMDKENGTLISLNIETIKN